MAETRLRIMSLAIWFTMVLLGVSLAVATDASIVSVVIGALAIGLAQLITVPAPSGERIYLGIGAAVAVPLLVPDIAGAGASFALGLALWRLVVTFRTVERASVRSDFVSETVALGAFLAAFELVHGSLALTQLAPGEADLVSLTAGGLAWYLVRASVRALVGLERDDLSPRYLWLLALEDWTVVISLFATGALFGLTFPAIRWWAIPVALMPYAFSHLAFVRYQGTRITYRQTIRALAQIPEVAGLASDGHAERTSELSLAVARELGLHPDQIAELEYAALMHDIGRITLNEPAILRAGYTDEDIARWGAQIVAEAPYLERVATLVQEQYRPYRSPGVERDPDVPLAAKIIKVTAAYDRAVHDLQQAPLEALESIHRGSAYEFDPLVAASLRRVLAHRKLIAS